MQKLHEASTSDITPADKANDRKSLLRNTPGFLYLLVNKPTGWAFPRIEFDEAKYKTTRQAGSWSRDVMGRRWKDWLPPPTGRISSCSTGAILRASIKCTGCVRH